METGKNETREPERREHIEMMSSGSVGFADGSVGQESTCNAGDPVQFLDGEDLLEKG